MPEELIQKLLEEVDPIVASLACAMIYLFLENKKHNKQYIQLLQEKEDIKVELAEIKGKQAGIEEISNKALETIREAILKRNEK